MTSEIEQSARYYELLARKHEASGRGPNQARVYRELVALVKQCASYEEIQARMKTGGYYESPGQALMLDKLLAHRDAATQLGFHRLAAVYQRRHDAVAADYRAAWTTGWDEEAKVELNRIGNVVAAFREVLLAYYELRCAHFEGQAEPLQKMRAAVGAMEANGEAFEAVVADSYYRLHCPLADDEYQQALEFIRYVLTHPLDHAAAKADFDARTRALIEGGDANELGRLRQHDEARQRRSVNLCVAPDVDPGPYVYEPFFEGKF
jgi:hypothetical protein